MREERLRNDAAADAEEERGGLAERRVAEARDGHGAGGANVEDDERGGEGGKEGERRRQDEGGEVGGQPHRDGGRGGPQPRADDRVWHVAEVNWRRRRVSLRLGRGVGSVLGASDGKGQVV